MIALARLEAIIEKSDPRRSFAERRRLNGEAKACLKKIEIILAEGGHEAEYAATMVALAQDISAALGINGTAQCSPSMHRERARQNVGIITSILCASLVGGV